MILDQYDVSIFALIGDRSFAATAPRLWNSLPDHIPAAVTTGQFKRLLKYHLFN